MTGKNLENKRAMTPRSRLRAVRASGGVSWRAFECAPAGPSHYAVFRQTNDGLQLPTSYAPVDRTSPEASKRCCSAAAGPPRKSTTSVPNYKASSHVSRSSRWLEPVELLAGANVALRSYPSSNSTEEWESLIARQTVGRTSLTCSLAP